MIRIDDDRIRGLLSMFMAATTDDRKQGLIDCLGLHPVNHAVFAHEIGKLFSPGSVSHSYLWADYLKATASL